MDIKNNSKKNESHFDQIYEKVNVDSIIHTLINLDKFLSTAKVTDTSWVGMYYNDFEKTLKGKKILELGSGDCLNAAIMCYFGAEVYANDISQKSGQIIHELNKKYDFHTPLKFVIGDFLETEIPPKSFDMVVGKAFVHHLTNEQENLFTKKIVKILRKDGIVRYLEPAVNSVLMDKIRFMIPVPNRPSIFQKEKFRKWKEMDPHPERDNSSKHYREIGNTYFEKVDIYCIGSIEKFHRLIPNGNFNRKFRRFAFKIEKMLPNFINEVFARSQVIIYKNPIK